MIPEDCGILETSTLRIPPPWVHRRFRIEILTKLRWPSWLITAHESLAFSRDPRLAKFLAGVTKGIDYFYSHIDEGIEYIAAHLGYTTEDARAWLKTVEYVNDASKVDASVVETTVVVLQKAGVVKSPAPVDSLVAKDALYK